MLLVSIPISVLTEFCMDSYSVLFDTVNHCGIEKNLRMLLLSILHAEEFIVAEMML